MPSVFTTQVAVKLIERSVDKITKNVSIQPFLSWPVECRRFHKKEGLFTHGNRQRNPHVTLC